MDLNHVLIIDSFLTPKECNKIIKMYAPLKFRVLGDHSGYEDWGVNITSEKLKFLFKKLEKATLKYRKKFPEVNYLSKITLRECRIKLFRPGKHFANWHADHDPEAPTRILGLMIYLSDHQCGTQFFNGDVVRSKQGRLIIWPSSFTHTHRGQKCPENKNRYLFSGYYTYIITQKT